MTWVLMSEQFSFNSLFGEKYFVLQYIRYIVIHANNLKFLKTLKGNEGPRKAIAHSLEITLVPLFDLQN